MNKSTLHEIFGCETKIQIPRSIWFPALLRWALVLAVLTVPQAGRAAEWHATVGAQSGDKGRQALAFLPNEIWIHAGDSIEWRWDADEVHTVTFIPDSEIRPLFQTIVASPNGSSFPDPTAPRDDVVSSPGQLADLGAVPRFR